VIEIEEGEEIERERERERLEVKSESSGVKSEVRGREGLNEGGRQFSG
jgi:hypothetical protein